MNPFCNIFFTVYLSLGKCWIACHFFFTYHWQHWVTLYSSAADWFTIDFSFNKRDNYDYKECLQAVQYNAETLYIFRKHFNRCKWVNVWSSAWLKQSALICPSAAYKNGICLGISINSMVHFDKKQTNLQEPHICVPSNSQPALLTNFPEPT